jgi:hypothetical protein
MRHIFEVMTERANQRTEPGFEMVIAMLGEKTLADIHAQGRDWVPFPRQGVTVTNAPNAELEQANAEIARLRRENLVMAEWIAELPRTEPVAWPPELEAEFQEYLKATEGSGAIVVADKPSP